MKKNFVSIIVNCHNGETYLKNALSSLINQTHKNWEVVFWDNNSSDNSKKIFEKFNDKRFRYFFSKKKNTLYKARKLALSKTRGEFISFLDVDDWWLPKKLETQLIKFKNKSIDFLFSNVMIYDEKKNSKKIWITKNFTKPITLSTAINDYKISILTTIFRKKLLKKLQLNFNVKYKIIGDFDLFIKIVNKVKAFYIHKPLAVYRMHENNFSKKNSYTWIKELEHWLNVNKEILSPENTRNMKKKILRLKIIFFCKSIKSYFFL